MRVTLKPLRLFVLRTTKVLPAKKNDSTRCTVYLIATLKNYLRSVLRKKNQIKPGPGSKEDKVQKKGEPMIHQDLIVKTARKHQLNPNLVAAVIKIESSFDTDAVRYEKDYKWLYQPEVFALSLNISSATETELQKFSWGLMQVMGAVAREHGHQGPMFRLCRPDLGIEFGCIHLAKYLRKYNDLQKALAAYNGGQGAIRSDGTIRNMGYVEKVMDHYSAGSIA